MDKAKALKKEYDRARYLRLQDSIKLRRKNHYKNNKERTDATTREYYLKHKDRILEYSKNYKGVWRILNADKVRIHSRIRAARYRAAGKITSREIQAVYEDNIKKHGTLTCYLCLKPIDFGKDSVDHMIPISRGGKNIFSNLKIACISCNSRKRTLTTEEYLARTR